MDEITEKQENMKKGINAFYLKLLAVFAMVCDHAAWGFVEEFSVAGQALHVFGRLTIPIMCFFIAEGLRHTGNLKKYIFRLAAGWLVSIVPFYLFFSEMYGYRQNIMFDLLLALLVVALMRSEKCKKSVKILGTAALLAVSCVVGGWPLLPIEFVLIFYFIEDKVRRTIAFVSVNTVSIVLLLVIIALNQRLHFVGFDWTWQEKLYLFGFSFAALPLWFYNGERGFTETRGRRLFGKYFFYAVYPIHLLILVFLQSLTS